MAKVRRAWLAAAGPEIAKKTRVETFERGVLTVAVASAAVKHHLSTFMAEQLLDDLQEHLDQVVVRRLKFKVGD
jgi:predicted nucleic acid-binding Zn ribbon protein